MEEARDDYVLRVVRILTNGQPKEREGEGVGEGHESALGRHLGLFSTTLLIVSTMVGTGIFSVPSSIIASVGSPGAALMLWVAGFVFSFCGMFVWLELGCMYPQSGGEKVYLGHAYPRPRLLALMLYTIMAVFLSSPAAGCVVFARNLAVALEVDIGDLGLRCIAVSAVLVISLIHAFIPKIGVKIMDVLSVIQIFMLLFVDLLGLYALLIGIHTIKDPQANFRNAFAGSSHSTYDYCIALLKVMQTYCGWSCPAYVTNEIKNPVRTLKIAGPLGLGIVGFLYIFANVAYFSVATPEEIADSGVAVAALFLSKVFGHTAGRIAAGFVTLSGMGFVMAHTFSMARVVQELAKEGMIPISPMWASSWPVGSPAAGILLVFLVTVVTIVVIPFGDAYNFIMDIMAYPTAIMSLAVTIGLFILRRRENNLQRPFKVWEPLAVTFGIAQAFLIVSPFIRPESGKGDTSLPYWLAPLSTIAIAVAGVIGWWIWRIVIPYAGYFFWEKYQVELADGTKVTKWKQGRHYR